MAKKTGLGGNFYVGGRDLSGDVGAVTTIAGRRAVLEVTAINRSAVERLAGMRDGEISFNTFFNDALDQEHDALKGLPTANVQVMYLQGTALGNEGACIVAKQINYDWDRAADGALLGTIQALANGDGLEFCTTLTAGKRTDTLATNGTGVDFATSEAFGMAAYLQVFSFTGTSVTVAIQESSDDGVTDPYAAVTGGTFAAATGRTSERIVTSLTLTVERWLRAVTTGTFTNAVFAVAVIKYRTAL